MTGGSNAGAGADLLQHLQAYIPGDRQRALAHGESMPDRVRGAALFADISGFTPLTEILATELGAHRGAEELTKHLNRVFHALIVELRRFDGHVIYFSGDAITCWFDGDDGSRAATCGLAMQQTMARAQEIVTPAGTRATLAMKASIAVGAARRFVVGDPEVQLVDVLAGALIDALAAAEHHANPGEVVLDRSAIAALAGKVEVGELRHDADGHACAPVLSMAHTASPASTHAAPVLLSEDIARRWLLPAVYERLRTGAGEFMTELRPAYPVFAQFGGIDYDGDDDAPAKLDAFVRQAQRIFFAYGGSLVHLSVGDKGAYLYGVFGAPLAHEDDAARAAAAALELRELPKANGVTDLRIGVTHGRLRSGNYGHEERQAFTCLGDAVNLAARLMSAAPAGKVHASAAVRDATRDDFEWTALEPIRVKGRREPVAAFELTASRNATRSIDVASALPMIGRAAELAAMSDKLEGALAARGAIVAISAEAGMGKTRLITEFARSVLARGISVAFGACQAFGRNATYFVWRGVWRTLFEIDDGLDDTQNLRKVEAALAAIDPALVARAPLLSGVLDLVIPDNELTAEFDAKLRKTSLEALLGDCLRARAAAAPLVIVLEDCHWIDPLSRDLLQVLARALPGLRCLFIVAYRPQRESSGGLALDRLEHFQEIGLTELGADDTARLIETKLLHAFGEHLAAPPELVELITRRAQGNPFYIEELLNYVRSTGCDPQDVTALKQLDLPDSLHSLILSRIDGLGEGPRRTIKVASVIGRDFRVPMLSGVSPELGDSDSLRHHLAALGSADLVHLELDAEQSYAFKHAVTQEVAYESMSFGFRSVLHERVGGYIEASESDSIERHLDLLAHHYWHSENGGKKREYLKRAGDAAQAAYANAAAIEYFEKLAPLADGVERVDVLLKLGKVLDLVGNWTRAEQVDVEAYTAADALQDTRWRAEAETMLGEVARKQGRFDEALQKLERAAADFERVGDEAGLGLVKHLLGTLSAQRGDYPNAIASYEASFAIRERLGDKRNMGSLLSNLGIVAEYRGDYDESRRLHERALALRTEINDRRGIGNSTTNLGMIAVLQRQFASAREWFEKSMALNREVGDAWMVALCDHNLANATRGLRDYDVARKHYAASLSAYRNYDDAWAIAFLLEDIAVLLAIAGDAPAAFELLGAADALRKSRDMPRAPSRQEEIDNELAAVHIDLAETDREKFRAYGRTLSMSEAIDHALAHCSGRDARERVATSGALDATLSSDPSQDAARPVG